MNVLIVFYHNSWQILLNSSCLAAYILPQTEASGYQATRSSAPWTVNPAFYTLIGYFKHFDIDEHFWAAAVCQNMLNQLQFLTQMGRAGDSSGPVEEYSLRTLTIIHSLYIFTQWVGPHCTAAHRENSRWPVLRWLKTICIRCLEEFTQKLNFAEYLLPLWPSKM